MREKNALLKNIEIYESFQMSKIHTMRDKNHSLEKKEMHGPSDIYKSPWTRKMYQIDDFSFIYTRSIKLTAIY